MAGNAASEARRRRAEIERAFENSGFSNTRDRPIREMILGRSGSLVRIQSPDQSSQVYSGHTPLASLHVLS